MHIKYAIYLISKVHVILLSLIIKLIPMSKDIKDGIDGMKGFAKDSARFLSACEKPDVAGTDYFSVEFKKIAVSCAIGFAIMGGIGYAVKLLFIPINNIILS